MWHRGKLIAALCAGLASVSQAATWWVVDTAPSVSVPTGASALGYTKLLFDERPRVEDISNDNVGAYKWFNGLYFQAGGSKVPMSRYSDTNGVLTISGGDTSAAIIGTPHDETFGTLPPIYGHNGFYVEFDIATSTQDVECLSAVWLQVKDHHDGSDIYAPDEAAGVAHWVELDVLETHFTANRGGHSQHNWSGTWSDSGTYTRSSNTNSTPAVDRDFTVRTRWGISYDPPNNQVKFYMDDALIVTSNLAMEVYPKYQKFYPTISHGKHSGAGAGTCTADLYVYNVQAWVP